MQKGRAIVWGVQPTRPLIDVPSDAQKVRLRLRPNDPAMAFVKYADRVEKWIVCPADGRIGCSEWRLGILQGVNHARV